MASPTLSQIIIYPVKSLAGINIESWDVDDKGLRYDRKWMLIDENKQFLSQRRLPEMALIKTQIDDNNLILSAPANDKISIPLDKTEHDSEQISVNIWKDQCLANPVSLEIDQWFSDFLNTPCRLVYLPETEKRSVDPNYALASDQTAFSDGFPFLIISQSSLDALNHAMQEDLPMNRFRPNLVISGCEPYAEDSWREVSISGINFRLPKPCSRCAVPTINQETAEQGKEPLLTLSRSRKWNKQVYFGQNALHSHTGQLSCGDQVKILTTGPKQPPL